MGQDLDYPGWEDHPAIAIGMFLIVVAALAAFGWSLATYERPTLDERVEREVLECQELAESRGVEWSASLRRVGIGGIVVDCRIGGAE